MCKPTNTNNDNDSNSIKGTLVREDNNDDVELTSPSKEIVYVREATNSDSSALTSTLGIVKAALALLGLICVGLIATTIALAAKTGTQTQTNANQEPSMNVDQTSTAGVPGTDYIYPSSIASNVPENTLDIETVFAKGTNTCENKNPKFENVDCVQ